MVLLQEKVYEEIESVCRGLDEDLYMADITALTYTEQVLKETMRLFPIFPAVSRQVSQDIKLSKFYLNFFSTKHFYRITLVKK